MTAKGVGVSYLSLRLLTGHQVLSLVRLKKKTRIGLSHWSWSSHGYNCHEKAWWKDLTKIVAVGV